GLDHHAHEDVVDLGARDPGPRHDLADYQGAQVDSRQVLERAAEPPEGRPGGGHDHGFATHAITPARALSGPPAGPPPAITILAQRDGWRRGGQSRGCSPARRGSYAAIRASCCSVTATASRPASSRCR